MQKSIPLFFIRRFARENEVIEKPDQVPVKQRILVGRFAMGGAFITNVDAEN